MRRIKLSLANRLERGDLAGIFVTHDIRTYLRLTLLTKHTDIPV
jgi:hypothetical protein